MFPCELGLPIFIQTPSHYIEGLWYSVAAVQTSSGKVQKGVF